MRCEGMWLRSKVRDSKVVTRGGSCGAKVTLNIQRQNYAIRSVQET